MTSHQKLWDKPLNPMLDEYFSPKHIKPTLTEIIENEMKNMGLDPKNTNDIIVYWEKKGIEVNA